MRGSITWFRAFAPGARDDGTRGLCRNWKRRPGPVCGGGWSLRHRPTDQLRRDDWLRRLQPGPEPGWRHRPCSRVDTTEQRDDE